MPQYNQVSSLITQCLSHMKLRINLLIKFRNCCFQKTLCSNCLPVILVLAVQTENSVTLCLDPSSIKIEHFFFDLIEVYFSHQKAFLLIFGHVEDTRYKTEARE